MKRDRATRILERVIGTIEAGATPAPVRELYVFGSYSRGALEPNDLDIVAIHDPPPESLMKDLEEKWKAHRRYEFDFRGSPDARFEAAMRRALRKPGESMDIFIGKSLQAVLERWRDLRAKHMTLVWSQENRDWQTRLAAIKPDPSARSAPRDQFISPKRVQCAAEDVEEITAMLHAGRLQLERLAAEEVELRLRPYYQGWLDHFIRVRLVGRRAMEVLPYALWWLQDKGAVDVAPWHNQLRAQRGRSIFLVRVGRLHLREIVWWFEREPKLQEQCQIPCFKRSGVNELLVFRRGKRWGKTRP